MPYRRQVNRRRYRPRRANKGGYVRKVARVEAKKAVRRTVETKMHDETWNSSIANVLSTFDVCATLTRGTGDNDFIGAYIKPTYMTIKYNMIGSDSYNILRMIIIQDKDSSGTPVIGTLFENSTVPLISALGSNYRDTYKLILDRRFSLKQYNASYVAPQLGTIRIPLRKLRRIKFNDAGSIIGGKIWIIMISDSSAVSHPVAQIYSRLYFQDA